MSRRKLISRRLPLLLYDGPILLMTAIFAGCFAAKAYAGGLRAWALGLLGVLLLLCASYLAVALSAVGLFGLQSAGVGRTLPLAVGFGLCIYGIGNLWRPGKRVVASEKGPDSETSSGSAQKIGRPKELLHGR